MLTWLFSSLWAAVAPWLAYVVAALICASPFIVPQIPVVGPLAEKVLLWRPPIPLFILLAIAAFAWLDRQGAIMQAVNKATRQYVAGAELAAKDAVITKMKQDFADASRLKDVAFKRAIEAQAADASQHERTSARIASDHCAPPDCAVWTKGDVEWLRSQKR